MEDFEYLRDKFERLLKESEHLLEMSEKNNESKWSIGYSQGHRDAFAVALDVIETEIDRQKNA